MGVALLSSRVIRSRCILIPPQILPTTRTLDGQDHLIRL